MPQQEGKIPYYFCDHPVAGVNWRPTRLVDEVSKVRVCGVCAVIPRKTVKLPCSHFLCEYCFASASKPDSRQCPLDRIPFNEAACTTMKFPSKIKNYLKVHCWNETAGCKFVGTMADLLQHYEKDCAFHFLICRSGRYKLLREDAVGHYLRGFGHRVSSDGSEYSASLQFSNCLF
ncbi:hypothetical protein MTO96_040980 [Rhipicephalus appendiculatus]